MYAIGEILNPSAGEDAARVVLEDDDRSRGERDVGVEAIEGGSQDSAGLLSWEIWGTVSRVWSTVDTLTSCGAPSGSKLTDGSLTRISKVGLED